MASMTPSRTVPPKRREWSLRSKAVRGVLYQILAIGLIVLVGWFLVHNTLANMRERGIQSGFDFMTQPAGFDIGERMFPYESVDPYWKAFLIGVANTLRVAIIGIVLTTILGTLLGVGRFSHNAIVRGLCYGYVELFRNVPILLQLLVWYLVLTELLPDSSAPMSIGQVYLSKGGLSFPAPEWAAGHGWMLLGALAGVAASWLYAKRARAQFEATGKPPRLLLPSIGLIVIGAALGWAAGGAPNEWRIPEVGDVAVTGGGEVTPEFVAVLLGLVLYTSAFVAEVVRAGIQSVPAGQSEASGALGLGKGHQMRLVILPQALRVIIPPMTNQFLNLTKNSSLAVAIGYPDVVSISNTAINQTGRAVECIAIIMLVYLTTSLSTSGLMNWYNKRSAIKER
jgi:general L-amino acid transport system permease protein